MKDKKYRIILFCMGFFIIITIWLIACADKLPPFNLFWSALLITLSYFAMIFDINIKRIPNELILVMITVWLILIVPVLIYDTDYGVDLIIDSLIGLLIGGGLFLLVYAVSRKGLGGGDVKFMAAAGLYLGFAGILPAILYGTILAAVTGLVLIISKKINRKETIPLAPFLFVGIMITIFTS